MSTFVLVHGAWHGGWVWQRVARELEQSGHLVLTPDLPGHGDDRTSTEEVTLQRYVEKVINVLDGCAEPVVLVGHSNGWHCDLAGGGAAL